MDETGISPVPATAARQCNPGVRGLPSKVGMTPLLRAVRRPRVGCLRTQSRHLARPWLQCVHIPVDDHYVEAHTSAGSAIVLIRFSAAIADLGDHGLQVHRSYWGRVPPHAAAGAERGA